MLDSVIGNLLKYGNVIEGVFWILVGVCFAGALLRPGHFRTKLIAAGNFIVFGCSDFVEYQTGAWWRPWWLMLWKGACVCVMAWQFIVYVRSRRVG